MSAILALTLVFGGVLPPAHMHRAGIEGRVHAVVHRHVADGRATPRSGLSEAAHGDHERALFLETFYERYSPLAPDVPVAVETMNAFAPPARDDGWPAPDEAHRTHGPPGTFFLTRAPPTLA
jgi:hypothetical protein